MTDDYPVELDALAPSYDTLEARVAASGVPYGGWSWETARLTVGSASDLMARTVRAWSLEPCPDAWGVVLYGGAGLGKTGAAISVVRDAAARRVGRAAYWNLVTSPHVVAAVASGEFRRRPAPAAFLRWRDLKSLLDRAKVGQPPWEETPPLTAEKVLAELEARCAVLALDDVDVDATTPWKEEVLLRLLEMPARSCRLVVTLNSDLAGPDGRARLGERVVDRLLDPDLFFAFPVSGESLRRRRP